MLGFGAVAPRQSRTMESEDAMTLKEAVRHKFEDAKKAGQREVKDLLSVVLGDIDTAEARSGKDLADPEVEKMLRDLVKHNGETIEHLRHAKPDDARIAVLEREVALLKTLLPQTLDAAAIVQALAPVRAEVLAAKNDGMATGVAMKHLKSQGLKVLGQDVTAAVLTIRTA
jgi:uncharacterized protein YqeY